MSNTFHARHDELIVVELTGVGVQSLFLAWCQLHYGDMYAQFCWTSASIAGIVFFLLLSLFCCSTLSFCAQPSVLSKSCRFFTTVFVERPYRSTVNGVAKRDEGNRILKAVAHSNKNEQPHTYHRNEAGTRPRTMIAHPHRSTRPR